jgi:hypothetical protein
MSLHRIRLRRPWHYEATAEHVRWRRRFNRPTGLAAQPRIELVCQYFTRGTMGVILNGQPLGTILGDGRPAAFDVSDRLAPGNELVIECAASQAGPTPAAWPIDYPPGEVCLEIGDAP